MNQIDLKGRTAVVTGAAKGIGYATVERLLASGAAVSLWDLDGARLAEAEAALAGKGQVQAEVLDVTDPAALAQATQATLARFGAIDVLVANAGVVGVMKTTWEHTLEDWERILRLDLTGVFLTCRAVIPRMLERGYGRIVTVSSIAGLEGNANNSAYSAAKAGIIALTKSLGKELAKSGVIVNCVTPSGIETELLAGITQEYFDAMMAKMPIGRLGSPEEAAALIAWLASEDCSFSTGAVFDLTGGRAVY
jgi:3-oxoacyl-[acyl-carrier protein] reductase